MDILCNNINCDGIGMRRADWDNFRECERIMLNGQQIWGYPLSDAVKSQIYEDIVTTGHHSASLAAEVWRAANLYCKSHAASHPDLTAQGKLLSAFVNADKDMYCSLPLALTPEAQSALPTRWIRATGNAYIETSFLPNVDTYMYLDFIAKQIGNDYIATILCSDINWNISSGFGFSSWNGTYNAQYGGSVSLKSVVLNERLKYTQNKNNVILEYEGGTITKTISGTPAPNTTLIIPGLSRNHTHIFQGTGAAIIDCRLGTNAIVENHYIPCVNNSANGMLDLETLTFYGNAAATGSFTIEKS